MFSLICSHCKWQVKSGKQLGFNQSTPTIIGLYGPQQYIMDNLYLLHVRCFMFPTHGF